MSSHIHIPQTGFANGSIYRSFISTRLFWVIAFLLSLLPTYAGASSISSQEICTSLYEEHGIIPDGCSVEQEKPAKKTEPVNAEIANTLPAELIESHIFFTSGGSNLDAEASDQLQTLSRILDMPLFSETCIRLVGHSDSSGSANANYEMALKRAERVASFLKSSLTRNTVHETLSQGEDAPIPGLNGTDPRNRRVAIWIKKCGG